MQTVRFEIIIDFGSMFSWSTVMYEIIHFVEMGETKGRFSFRRMEEHIFWLYAGLDLDYLLKLEKIVLRFAGNC